MAREAEVLSIAPALDEPDFGGDLGDFRVEVRGNAAGGAISLRPSSGADVRIVIQGDTLTMHWDGPQVRLEAPAAEHLIHQGITTIIVGPDMTLAARNLHLRAEETFTVEARREVDIHSGTDVEVRADHHVNLWGHGVLVGD